MRVKGIFASDLTVNKLPDLEVRHGWSGKRRQKRPQNYFEFRIAKTKSAF